MTLIDRLGAGLPRAPVTVDLDDIQATVLRYRPEPYYGTHVMLRVTDAQAGREFLRRLTPHVDSAADWWQAGQTWISAAISYAGLVALGVPEDSLQSFPEAFRVGMAACAGQLLDYEENDPKHWDAPFGSGLIHLGVSVFSDSEQAWRRTMEMARQQYKGYGAPYDPNAISAQDDETPRGLYFIFISAKAMATLEFLQQEWINNGNFMSLGSERDPNVGLQEDGATFTIPQEPVRRRIHGIETFNVLRGGEYFFLPSLSALRWLADLRY
jgi:deferrochelatase/peroxidase EfeB